MNQQHDDQVWQEDEAVRPTHRPTSRVEQTAAKLSSVSGETEILSGDCISRSTTQSSSASTRPAVMRRRYATSARAQQIEAQLTDRDQAIIHILGEVTVASSVQLERLHFDTLKPSSRTRQRNAVLKRLTKQGVLARLPRRIGGVRAGSSGHIYALDILGQKLVGRTKTRRPPNAGWPYLAHALAVTDVLVQATEAQRLGQLNLTRFVSEPRCWNLIEGQQPLRPDAVISVRPTIGNWIDHWAVEVDRATERPVRIRRKLLTYLEAFNTGSTLHGTAVFPKILFSVPDEDRLHEVLRVVDKLPFDATELVVPVLHDEVGALLATGGPS